METPAPEAKGGKLLRFILKAQAESHRDTLWLSHTSLPGDAKMITVENCVKCRSKRWSYIFYWHTLPYDRGDYETIFYLKDNHQRKDTLTIKYKVK